MGVILWCFKNISTSWDPQSPFQWPKNWTRSSKIASEIFSVGFLFWVKKFCGFLTYTGCPISLSTLCFWHFSWTKLILNVKVEDVFKNSENLLHDCHKNFENPCRNGWYNWGQSWHLHWCYSKIKKKLMRVAKVDLNYLLGISKLDHVANFLNFLKHPQLLHLGYGLSDKTAKKKV